MKELDLQDKYLINLFCERPDGLHYKEAKANTVSPNFFVIEDLKHFISETTLNKSNYKKLLKKFDSEKLLLEAFTEFLDEKIKSSMNSLYPLLLLEQNTDENLKKNSKRSLIK